jgi:predicted TIM-barrel fold metal-dependent hydrolase
MQSDMNKRFERRNEPIQGPDLPIIDARHQLFDQPVPRHMLADDRADIGAGHEVVASVYCETLAFARVDGTGALQPIAEIEFANGVGAISASGVYGPASACAAMWATPRGLSFDAAVLHNQLSDIAALADAFPDTTIVPNHAGTPMTMVGFPPSTSRCSRIGARDVPKSRGSRTPSARSVASA